jgi:hypothetical protein
MSMNRYMVEVDLKTVRVEVEAVSKDAACEWVASNYDPFDDATWMVTSLDVDDDERA